MTTNDDDDDDGDNGDHDHDHHHNDDHDDGIVVGNLLQFIFTVTNETRLPMFDLLLRIQSCCEVDEQSCLGMVDRCKIL